MKLFFWLLKNNFLCWSINNNIECLNIPTSAMINSHKCVIILAILLITLKKPDLLPVCLLVGSQMLIEMELSTWYGTRFEVIEY